MSDRKFYDLYSVESFRDWWTAKGSKPLEDLYPMYRADTYWMPEPGPNFERAALDGVGTELDLETYLVRMSDPRIETPLEESHRYAARQCNYYSQLPLNYQLPAVEGKRAKLKQGNPSRYIHASAFNGFLTYLYWAALYDPQYSMVIRSRNVDVPCRFFPGHLIGDRDPAGPKRARIMVVDKAPGREEAENQRNLVGPGGRIFKDALREVGFSPEEIDSIYVTNVMRFMNPDISSDRIAADPIRDCTALLALEVRLVRPDYIVLLGSEAIKVFLGKKATLASTTGTPIEYPYDTSQLPRPILYQDEPEAYTPELSSATIFTCLHPNRVEGEPQYRTDLVRQLSGFEKHYRAKYSGKVFSNGQDVELQDLDHRLITTEEALVAWVDEVIQARPYMLAFDTEFEGLFPGDDNAYLRTIQFSWAWKKAVCIAVTHEGGASDVIPRAAITRELTRLLAIPHVRLVCHYSPADLPQAAIELNLPQVYTLFEAPDDDPIPADGVLPEGWRSGPEKTRTEGGFDTILAAHAIEETQALNLLDLGMRYTTVGPYDRGLEEYITTWCADGKLNGTGKSIPRKKLTGYGRIPLDILWSYACYDADLSYRLAVIFNEGIDGKPALLDCDRFGHNVRVPFWISSRAAPAFLEMKTEGLCIDKNQAGRIRTAFESVRAEKLQELRNLVRWPSFNPNSVFDCRALLFGPHMTRKAGKKPYELPINYQTAGGVPVKLQRQNERGETVSEFVPLPADQQPRTLNLQPYISSGDKRLWTEIVDRGQQDRYAPATDKESLAQLGLVSEEAWLLRDIRFLTQIIQSLLKAPVRDGEGRELDADGKVTKDFEEMEYEEGILSYLCSDGRIRPNYSQTKETGRASTWKPTVQNISKRRDKDYKRLLQDRYPGPIRSFIVAPPGWVFVEFDYAGAELTFVAGQSGDLAMREAVRRMQIAGEGYNEYGQAVEGGEYPHPDHRCIHSSIAIQAFQLRVKPDTYTEQDLIFLKTCGFPANQVHPSKWGLNKIGELRLRDAAKCVIFGYLYGMGPSSAMRKCKEEGVSVTFDQAVDLIDGLEDLYPGLPGYFKQARRMVRECQFLVTAYGRYRRFHPSSNEKIVVANEREGQNVPMQGGVADAVQIALSNFYYHPSRKRLDYRIQLQLHDAILFAVRPDAVEEFIQEVAPECMVKQVPVPVRSVDGTYRGDDCFFMSIDSAVYEQWGVKLKKDRAEALGIPAKYAS